MIRAFLVTLVTFAYVLVLGPPLLIYGWLTGNTGPIYKTGQLGAKMALWLAGVRLEVKGLENIPPDCAVVFMANHQGNSDPPVLLALLPPIVILTKKEFFRVPVLGRAMRARGFVPVDRKNREQAIAAVEQAVARLKEGKSFLVFPEGTRSPDGRLQAFKKGVFVMALKAQTPIVPISISGSARIMRKGEFVMHPGLIRITAHAPIPTAGRTLDDRGLVMEQVRQALLAGLDKDEWPLEELAAPSPTPSASPAA